MKAIFFIIIVSTSSKCFCDTIGSYYYDTLLNQIKNKKISEICNGNIECYEKLEEIGINLNPCGDALLQCYRSKNIDSLNTAEFESLMMLQKKCFDFQKDIGFSANFCKDPYLQSNNFSDQSVSYIELLNKQCNQMLKKLSKSGVIDSNDLKTRNSVFERPILEFDEPNSGKTFLIPSAIMLPCGILATIFTSSLYRKVNSSENLNFDPLSTLLFSTFGTVVLDVGTIALGTIGFVKKTKHDKYQKIRSELEFKIRAEKSNTIRH